MCFGVEHSNPFVDIAYNGLMGYVVEPAKRIGVVEYDFSNKRSVDDTIFNRQWVDLIAKL